MARRNAIPNDPYLERLYQLGYLGFHSLAVYSEHSNGWRKRLKLLPFHVFSSTGDGYAIFIERHYTAKNRTQE
jgi:hypothetical protein